MKNNFIKLISLALAAFLLCGITACSNKQEGDDTSSTTDSLSSIVSSPSSLEPDLSDAPTGYTYKNPYAENMNIKPMLLYVGYAFNSTTTYAEFTDEDIKQMTDSGIKDFVLLTTSSPKAYYDIDEKGNNVGELKHIITEEILASMTLDDLNSGSFDLSSMTALYRTRSKSTTDDMTLNQQTMYEIELAKRILEINPDAKFWFNLPHIECMALGDHYAKPYVNVIYKLIKTQFTEEQFEKNVGGLYWSSEDTGAWDTPFDNKNTVDFGNPMMKTAKYCSDFVHADGKTLLWIPFTKTEGQILRIGYTANTSNIFDVVFMQAGYFWHEEDKDMIDLLQRSTKANAVLNSSGVPYGGKKTSDTVVGAEIEIDTSIAFSDGQEYLDRYYGYYNALIEYKDTSAIAFYCGDKRSLMYDSVYSEIAKWYE